MCICVCPCVGMYTYVCRCLGRPEEGTAALGAGFTGSCGWILRTKPMSSGRAVLTLSLPWPLSHLSCPRKTHSFKINAFKFLQTITFLPEKRLITQWKIFLKSVLFVCLFYFVYVFWDKLTICSAVLELTL